MNRPADRPDPSSPSAVAQAEFSLTRKGFAPDEVRAFLVAVGAELERAASRLAAVESELAQARRERLDLGEIDDATLSTMVGEETAAVLRTAREGAAALRERAEQSATEMLDAAAAEAARLRRESADAAARVLADAKAEGRQLLDEAARHRERLDLATQRHRESAKLWAAEVEVEQRRLAEQFLRVRTIADEAMARLGPPPSATAVDHVENADTADDAGADEAEESPTLYDADAETVTENVADGTAIIDTESPSSNVDDSTANVVRLFAVPEPEIEPEIESEVEPESSPTETEMHEPVVDEGPPAVVPVSDESAAGVTEAADDTEPAESPRDLALGKVPATAIRVAKRVLADEQNAVLETLSASRAVTDLADLLPGLDEHVAMYVASVIAELESAASIGSGGAETAASLDTAREAVADMVATLRDRIELVVADAAGDNQVIAKRLRALYRDVKSTVVEPALIDAVLHAHAAGQIVGAEGDTRFRWVVEAGVRACPDCEDNSLASPTTAGEPFPAGHLAPPAHPGCRCELVADHG